MFGVDQMRLPSLAFIVDVLVKFVLDLWAEKKKAFNTIYCDKLIQI